MNIAGEVLPLPFFPRTWVSNVELSDAAALLATLRTCGEFNSRVLPSSLSVLLFMRHERSNFGVMLLSPD